MIINTYIDQMQANINSILPDVTIIWGQKHHRFCGLGQTISNNYELSYNLKQEAHIYGFMEILVYIYTITAITKAGIVIMSSFLREPSLLLDVTIIWGQQH